MSRTAVPAKKKLYDGVAMDRQKTLFRFPCLDRARWRRRTRLPLMILPFPLPVGSIKVLLSGVNFLGGLCGVIPEDALKFGE